MNRIPRRHVRLFRGGQAALAGIALMAAASAWAESAATIAGNVCVACHGADGNSMVPMFPKLAGQHPEYLNKQMLEFASGKRKNDMMAPMVANLSKDDFSALAAYFAGQKGTPGKVEDAKLAEAGKRLYEDGNTDSGVPACVGCHQPEGAGNQRFPRLAGQHQAYTLQQMADFKSGTRANDRGKVMRAVADRMTPEEMKAVSEYLAGL